MTSFSQRRKYPRLYHYKIREVGQYTGSYNSLADLNLLGFENNVPVLTIVKDERITKERANKKLKTNNSKTPKSTTTCSDHDYTSVIGPSLNLESFTSDITDKINDDLDLCKEQKCSSPINEKKSLWQINFFNDLKSCTQFDLNGNLPIHCAVLSNNLNLVLRQSIALYIRSKTVDLHNVTTLTPLQMAIIHDCCFEILQTLLHYKADPFVIDRNGNTLLHLAVLHLNEGSLKMLLLLTEFDLNASNHNGETPLILCASNKKWGHADVLLSAGADPNLSDKRSGRCPLFYAIEENDLIMVKTLLEYGALTRVHNFMGLSPHEIVQQLDTVSNGIKSLILQNSQLQIGIKRRRKCLSLLN